MIINKQTKFDKLRAKYNRKNKCQLQFQKLHIDVLKSAKSCGVFHTDLGVYVQNDICKLRALQKNNRQEVQGDFMTTFPHSILTQMTPDTFEKCAVVKPTQFTPPVMQEIYDQNRSIYNALNRWFWSIKLSNKVHYLYGWIHCKLTHQAVSVKHIYIYIYIYVFC